MPFTNRVRPTEVLTWIRAGMTTSLWNKGRLRCMRAPVRVGDSGLLRVLVYTEHAEAIVEAKNIATEWLMPARITGAGNRKQTWLNVRWWDATRPWTGDGLPPRPPAQQQQGPAGPEGAAAACKGPAPNAGPRPPWPLPRHRHTLISIDSPFNTTPSPHHTCLRPPPFPPPPPFTPPKGVGKGQNWPKGWGGCLGGGTPAAVPQAGAFGGAGGALHTGPARPHPMPRPFRYRSPLNFLNPNTPSCQACLAPWWAVPTPLPPRHPFATPHPP